jgi:hypothetical protein
MKFKFAFAAVLTAIALTQGGCTMRPDITVYQAETPKLELAKYFQGKTTAHGMVEDWRGKIIRRFTATLEGKFDSQGNGTLHENFNWSDGQQEQRTWQVMATGPATFKATAGDVVGHATGTHSGNAINWRYTLAVPTGTKDKPSTINLNMDDWMYQLPDGTILNQTEMRKFGFKVGKVTIFIQRAK